MFENAFGGLILAIGGPILWGVFAFGVFDEQSIGRPICIFAAVVCLFLGIGLYTKAHQGAMPIDAGQRSSFAESSALPPSHFGGVPFKDLDK